MKHHSNIDHGNRTSVEIENQDLSESTTDDTVEKSSVKEFFTKYRKTLGIAALSIGLVAGASVAINQANASAEGPVLSPNQQEQGDINGENGPGYIVDTETTEEETEVETETEAEMSYEELVASLEIPAGLSNEEFADTLVDRLTKMINAGVETDEKARKTFDDLIEYVAENGNSQEDQYFLDIAEENVKPYIEALLVDEGKRIDVLSSSFISDLTSRNAGVTRLAAYTSPSDDPYDPYNEKNQEIYKQWWEVDEVKSLGSGQRLLNIWFTRYSNADKNIAKVATYDRRDFIVVETTIEDGVEKISGFDIRKDYNKSSEYAIDEE